MPTVWAQQRRHLEPKVRASRCRGSCWWGCWRYYFDIGDARYIDDDNTDDDTGIWLVLSFLPSTPGSLFSAALAKPRPAPKNQDFRHPSSFLFFSKGPKKHRKEKKVFRRPSRFFLKIRVFSPKKHYRSLVNPIDWISGPRGPGGGGRISKTNNYSKKKSARNYQSPLFVSPSKTKSKK